MIEKYDYRKAMKNDVLDYIKEEEISFSDYESVEQLQEYLYDVLLIEAHVAGGDSYTCNPWEAENNLAHNLKLLNEALNELNADYKKALENAEFCDVSIRRYLLPEIITEVLEELNAEKKIGGQ